jgi:hypothetical protein
VQSVGEERNAYRHSLLWLVQFQTGDKSLSFCCKSLLYNFGVCTIWQFLLLLGILKMTPMTVQLCDGILCDFIVMLGRVHF